MQTSRHSRCYPLDYFTRRWHLTWQSFLAGESGSAAPGTEVPGGPTLGSTAADVASPVVTAASPTVEKASVHATVAAEGESITVLAHSATILGGCQAHGQHCSRSIIPCDIVDVSVCKALSLVIV